MVDLGVTVCLIKNPVAKRSGFLMQIKEVNMKFLIVILIIKTVAKAFVKDEIVIQETIKIDALLKDPAAFELR